MASLAAANTKFSLDLFQKISETRKTDNVFYSPLSISSALSMVYMGARGNTASQMSQVLGFGNEKKPEDNPELQQVQRPQLPQQSGHFQKTDDDIHAGFRKVMSELNKEGAPYSLSLANRLYGEQSFQFEKKYIDDTKRFYLAELETVDFVSKAEDARAKINSWVEKQTQEKIKDLLSKGDVDEKSILVLVNAIYFKGEWLKKFEGIDTREEQFKLNKSESKPVKMMHQTATFRTAFVSEVNSLILEMPYLGGAQGNELSMFIILPREIQDDSTGLEKLERALTHEKLIDWTQPCNMATNEVKVALPKFKMEETYNLKEVLVGMGMADAFDLTKSDFSGMSPIPGVAVSKVVHKSFVEVNEEGTEAAAATAVIGMVGSTMAPRPPPVVFIADHPFLFFLRHNPTRSLLFYGRLCSP